MAKCEDHQEAVGQGEFCHAGGFNPGTLTLPLSTRKATGFTGALRDSRTSGPGSGAAGRRRPALCMRPEEHAQRSKTKLFFTVLPAGGSSPGRWIPGGLAFDEAAGLG